MSVNGRLKKPVPAYMRLRYGFPPEILLGTRVVTTAPEGPPGVVGRFIMLDQLKNLLNVIVKPFHAPCPSAEEMRRNTCIFLNENSVITDVWLPTGADSDPFGENDETGLGGLHIPEKK